MNSCVFRIYMYIIYYYLLIYFIFTMVIIIICIIGIIITIKFTPIYQFVAFAVGPKFSKM